MRERIELFLSSLAAAFFRLTGSYRRRYLGALDSLPPGGVKRVIFVCRGNICRSPYAAVKLRSIFPAPAPEIYSAGLDTTPGKPADPSAVAAAKKCGIGLDTHLTSRATGPELAAADLIVAMDNLHLGWLREINSALLTKTLLLGALEPAPGVGPIIPDPYGRPEADFLACYSRIDRCLEKLVIELGRKP